MTNHKQRKENGEEGKNSLFSFKTNLINRFYDIVKEGMTVKSCHYVAHNIINNREISLSTSFSKNLEEPTKYWEDYWGRAASDYENQRIVKMSVCAKPDRGEPEDKKQACKMQDGFHFYIQQENGRLENFSFWWEKYDLNRISRQKVEGLCRMLTEFKIGHFRLNKPIFDAFPAVY